MSFNPLNQVYVFNQIFGDRLQERCFGDSFNPLNQVYVFNRKLLQGRKNTTR